MKINGNIQWGPGRYNSFFMIKNNENCVVIMGSWCTDPDDKHGGRYITIPKGWVKKIEYLNVGHADIRN